MSTPVEVLLVEDDPADIALVQHAFRKHHLTNTIHVVRAGPRRSSTSSAPTDTPVARPTPSM